ncbi:MAG: glycoside hydrolase family 15 protein [Actinomycetota bacterium]|nr:glycoside hydrolase family 15 protein [Actinomycetota bacterium]
MYGTSIGEYALLSDCQSAALVRRDGSVDWYSPPRFDSPSVFAHLLDEEGGHWSIRPAGDYEVERAYLDDTMVLRTEFRTEDGRVALTDALAFGEGARGHDIGKRVPHVLLRQVEGLEGEVEMALEFYPRLEYALTIPRVLPTDAGVVARGGPTELHLQTDCSLSADDSGATARFAVRAGEAAKFALLHRRAAFSGEGAPPELDVNEELENTAEGWRSWVGIHSGYEGSYAEQVLRSALVLQALTYAPTGAVVAAATTSLPESLGGSLNWDYRFAWLRDLSLTLRALWVAACPDEVERFFHWINGAVGGHPSEHDHIQIMYGVEGERDLTEHSLEHLNGFRGSRPVRVGNEAWKQKQLDVTGEVVYAVHLLRDQLGEEFDGLTAHLVSTVADRAAKSWREPDAGMWEARDKERHYLTSKVMCWVALDRAIQLAPRLGEHADAQRVRGWEEARKEVWEAILERGWSEQAGAYTGAFGSDQLDASVLMMPLVDFLPVTDPRMWATIEAVERKLTSDGLVHRWDGDENGFLLCSYWLVECLARAGEAEKATEVFEKTNAYTNDLGLLAEMVDAKTGELIGNFPQAFSHIGLVNAAWTLAQVREEGSANVQPSGEEG